MRPNERKKEERHKTTNVKKERGDFTTNPIKIKGIIGNIINNCVPINSTIWKK